MVDLTRSLPKTIVICSDGTGNHYSGTPSNVPIMPRGRRFFFTGLCGSAPTGEIPHIVCRRYWHVQNGVQARRHQQCMKAIFRLPGTSTMSMVRKAATADPLAWRRELRGAAPRMIDPVMPTQ